MSGDGRYAVTFQRPDGSEQTTVVHTGANGVEVTAAGLPDGWAPESAAFHAAEDAVLAVERARSLVPHTAVLHDVDGGWDVRMGNVVMSETGVPQCPPHGELERVTRGRYTCSECGASAGLG